MKKLNTWQNLVFQVGGLLVLVGACLPLFGLEDEGSFILLVGALAFGSMQCLAGYGGRDSIVRRLRRQQIFGALLLIVAGVLAVIHTINVGALHTGLSLPHTKIISHIGSGEWKICLAIAAVLEIYTAFRIPAALRASGEEE